MHNSQLEIINQAQTLLANISKEHYTHICKPHMSGSVGMHMRHVIDHYNALISGVETGVVDYNVRHRFAEVETDPKAAMTTLQRIADWITGLDERQMLTPVSIVSEISITSQRNAQLQSSLQRELMFVASHSIHHFSLIAISCSLLGVKIDRQFGYAPATLSYIRQA